jgi:hypothetical protein
MWKNKSFWEAESYFYSIFRRKTFSMWKSVALPIRIRLINNPAYVYTLWVTIIHRGGRGSEIVVWKLRVYVDGMLCWENGYLLSRENANLFQSGISKLVYSVCSVLHSGATNGSGEMLMWWPGNLKIDSRESRGDSPLYTGDWQLRCRLCRRFFVPGEIAFLSTWRTIVATRLVKHLT